MTSAPSWKDSHSSAAATWAAHSSAACSSRARVPKHISVGEAYEPARAALAKDFGITATADNAAAVADATVVVLAVKPQDAGTVLAPLAPLLQTQRVRCSSRCARACEVAALESWCGGGIPVVRTMPNRPALVGAGATGLFAPRSCHARRDRARAEAVMRAMGEVVWVHDGGRTRRGHRTVRQRTGLLLSIWRS